MTTTGLDLPSTISRSIATDTGDPSLNSTDTFIDEARLRDSWCTPLWLVDLLTGGSDGLYNFDPCSNPRSHAVARDRVMQEDGGNGLPDGPPGSYIDIGLTFRVLPSARVFVNPPYSRGQAIRWIRHWSYANFTFLLRWDPSTAWWREIMQHTACVWFPDRRIQFDPPPGIAGRNNPFPHALYFKRYVSEDTGNRLWRRGKFLYT